MSPFRHLFRQAGVKHPVGYSILLLAAGMIVCMVTAVHFSIAASKRAIRESERNQCGILAVTIKAYDETPPTTEAGRNVRQSTIDYYRSLGCPEPKE